jgi:hypothetical protein
VAAGGVVVVGAGVVVVGAGVVCVTVGVVVVCAGAVVVWVTVVTVVWVAEGVVLVVDVLLCELPRKSVVHLSELKRECPATSSGRVIAATATTKASRPVTIATFQARRLRSRGRP